MKRRPLWWAVGALLGILLLGGGSWWLRYRLDYGTFAFWEPPEGIHYCGRNYFPDAGTPPVIAAPPKDQGPIVLLPQIRPMGRRVWARTVTDKAAAPLCAYELYVQSGAGVIVYNLSGSP